MPFSAGPFQHRASHIALERPVTLCVPDVNLRQRNTAPAGPKQTKPAKGSGMNPWAGGLYPLPLVAGG